MKHELLGQKIEFISVDWNGQVYLHFTQGM